MLCKLYLFYILNKSILKLILFSIFFTITSTPIQEVNMLFGQENIYNEDH